MNFDLKNLNYESIKKEMFVDCDMGRHRFLIYIIDHIKKQIIPYWTENAFETVECILDKYKQFNIEQVGLYTTYGYMFPIYNSLKIHNINISDRRDIYHWRMTLEPHIRNITYPIYYYEVLYHYKFINEQDYLNS